MAHDPAQQDIRVFFCNGNAKGKQKSERALRAKPY
jgi:hypothetical protein